MKEEFFIKKPEQKVNKMPQIDVLDKRNPKEKGDFDLADFLEDIKIFLLNNKEYDKETRNRSDWRQKYDNYSLDATCENEGFRKNLRRARKIKIIVKDIAMVRREVDLNKENNSKNLKIKRTAAHIFILGQNGQWKKYTFYFNPENGKFISSGYSIYPLKKGALISDPEELE